MFKVLENGKDCTSKARGRPQGNGWDNCEFVDFDKALLYAKSWLGDYDTIPFEWNGKPYNFSGYGDTIEIRQIQNLG